MSLSDPFHENVVNKDYNWDEAKTINFTGWVGSNRRLTRIDRLKYWFMRKRLYQWYAWKRYGKKVIITKWIKFERKDV